MIRTMIRCMILAVEALDRWGMAAFEFLDDCIDRVENWAMRREPME